eukprot:COSAG05_NODE_2590_length_2865_cov_2.359364_2_plen_75_part_00
MDLGKAWACSLQSAAGSVQECNDLNPHPYGIGVGRVSETERYHQSILTMCEKIRVTIDDLYSCASDRTATRRQQ